MQARYIRGNQERKAAKELVEVVQEQEEELGEEVKVYRMGKYNDSKTRALQCTGAEKILLKSWKLSKKENIKNVPLRKDTNEEERFQFVDLFK